MFLYALEYPGSIFGYFWYRPRLPKMDDLLWKLFKGGTRLLLTRNFSSVDTTRAVIVLECPVTLFETTWCLA